MSKYQCIFCQSAEKLSKEHIWADWLRNYVPRPSSRSWHHVAGSATDRNIVSGKLNRQGDLHAQRLQIVCKRCNETWMSGIQSAAKPHIVSLLSGWPRLDRGAQATLAAWATMFTMVYEFADPATAVVQQEHRTYFKENQSPPPDWTVWLGKVDLQSDHSGSANHHGAVTSATDPNALPKPFHFQSTGFTVGSIFFQTLMFDPPYIKVKSSLFASDFDIRTIHPFENVILDAPIPIALDRMGFYAVSNSFAAGLGLPVFIT